MLAIDPEAFGDVQGSTDTEVVFNLALTFGLDDDPLQALELTVGLIEETARRHDVAGAVQASFGATDGATLSAVRYATEGPARSLFASADVEAIRHLHPADLPGVWREIPQRTAVTVQRGGRLNERPFSPRTPG